MSISDFKMPEAMSRRTLLRAGISAAGAAALIGTATRPASAKLAQSAIGYQDSPHGSQDCSNCNLFEAPASCKSVSGKISPNGWCKIYVKKAG
ncbi:MAG: high-potential iron-sulfur protein [Beijerinckiaceae bacterium]|nr:high-potential iron-sulfur protein [Beijerinckiaceae bacterium]